MSATLSNTQVLIVGGTSGIGLATARAALREGANVTITGRDANRLAKARESLRGEALGVNIDASDEVGTKDLIASFDSLDHLFITVGTLVFDPRLEPGTDELRPAIDVRFWSALYAAKYAAPKMHAGSSITFMSGTAGRRPLAGASVASASCGAVDAFARALVLDLAPIRVNTISPGYVDTPLLDGLLGDNREAVLTDAAAALPVKRIGTPEDIAHAVLFLMTNGYVNGINLAVDGGGLLV